MIEIPEFGKFLPVESRVGGLPFNKNSGLKFGKFYVPNGAVHSGCTDLTQATARLVIVLVSRIQQGGTRDSNFVKWKGTFNFSPTGRNDQTGQRRSPSKLVWNIPVGPNRNGPFPLIYQRKFPEFWAECKAPRNSTLGIRNPA